MFVEIKELKVRCDYCSKSSKVISTTELPKGWTKQQVGPCGLTNYFRTETYCPICSKK